MILDSGFLDFADFTRLGNEGNRIAFDQYTTNVQPIYEPDNTQINNNNVNRPGNQNAQTGTTTPPTPVLPSK